MTYDLKDLAKAFQLLSKEPQPHEYVHPGQEILVAYLECRLSNEESEEIRTHLALCGLCAGLLLDWQEDFEELVTPNLDEEWSRFRQNLYQGEKKENSSKEEQKHKALRALERLAALRKGLPPVDAVEVIRSVRDEPADRETD